MKMYHVGLRCKNLAALAVVGAVSAAGSIVSAAPAPLVDFADVASDVKADLTPAVTGAIGIGVALFVVTLGWKLVKRFAR